MPAAPNATTELIWPVRPSRRFSMAVLPLLTPRPSRFSTPTVTPRCAGCKTDDQHDLDEAMALPAPNLERRSRKGLTLPALHWRIGNGGGRTMRERWLTIRQRVL